MRKSAKKCIKRPIISNDVEIEICWSYSTPENWPKDVDNIIKPSLDALNKIAYKDDKQVRSVTSTRFDLNSPCLISGRVEHIGNLFYSGNNNAILFAIYSDTRLNELGGEEVVKKNRFKEWEKRFKSRITNLKGNGDTSRHSTD